MGQDVCCVQSFVDRTKGGADWLLTGVKLAWNELEFARLSAAAALFDAFGETWTVSSLARSVDGLTANVDATQMLNGLALVTEREDATRRMGGKQDDSGLRPTREPLMYRRSLVELAQQLSRAASATSAQRKTRLCRGQWGEASPTPRVSRDVTHHLGDVSGGLAVLVAVVDDLDAVLVEGAVHELAVEHHAEVMHLAGCCCLRATEAHSVVYLLVRWVAALLEDGEQRRAPAAFVGNLESLAVRVVQLFSLRLGHLRWVNAHNPDVLDGWLGRGLVVCPTNGHAGHFTAFGGVVDGCHSSSTSGYSTLRGSSAPAGALRTSRWETTLHAWGRLAAGPSVEDARTLHGSHDLRKIRERLDATCVCLGWPKTPSAIGELVDVFAEIEKEQASRLRYDLVRSKCTQGLVKSFPNELDQGTPIYVSCRAISRKLEDMLSAYALDPEEPGAMGGPLTELQAFFLAYGEGWRDVEEEDQCRMLAEYECRDPMPR